ncbi:Tigger transposable element-derived protein 7-like 34 [Homarus americanus]|uniref:Tigger transposable element-derived protein 7-like 34 n=1 Tax=Homarus americanus TaxID=6706 RepID=A0A8J5JG87_HOMAM|nr:Tigger transposable element-derived protein 7-like 34 [Homarus americanus]
MYRRYKQELSTGLPIHGIVILSAAEHLAVHHNNHDFQASKGRSFKFWSRHRRVTHKIVGERLGADTTSVQPFREKLTALVKDNRLLLSQLYNGDTSDLVWKSLPNNIHISRLEAHVPDRKAVKNCIVMYQCR